MEASRILARLARRFALRTISSMDDNIIANEFSSAKRCSVPTSISDSKGKPLFLTNSSESENGTVSSALECRMIVLGFTVVAVPHFFQAGQRRTRGVFPLSMFMATAPPRLEPTTTSGLP